MADSYSSYYNQAPYNYGAPSSASASTPGSFGVDPQTSNSSLYPYQGGYGDQYGMNAQQQYQQQMSMYQTPQAYQPLQAYQPPQPYQPPQAYPTPDQYQQQQQPPPQSYPYMDPSTMYPQAAPGPGGQDYYNYSIQQMAYQQLQQSYEKQAGRNEDTPLQADASKKKEDDEGGLVFGVDLSKQAPEEQQNHMQQQMAQQLQQAFEKQIHQQIHQMVLQKLGQPAGNSDGRKVFGEDGVGVGASAEVAGGLGSEGKSKYYCSTCDINYANSLAFTSHLGSREHKVQKERLDKDPSYREDFLARVQQKQQQQLMQQQQSTVRSLPGKKQLQCRLCNVAFNGAELYAVHLKSYEHQQMLKISRENKVKVAMYARPMPASFGVDLNPSKHYPEPSPDGLGLEFIEELRDEAGQVIRVFCNLCKFDIDNEELKMLHLNGPKHSTLYKERMEKYQGGYMAGEGGPMGGPMGAQTPQMQAIIQQQLDQQLQQALPQLNLPAGQQDAFVQRVNMQVHSMLQQSIKPFDDPSSSSSAPYPPMSQYNYPPYPPFPSADYAPLPPPNFNRPPVHFGMSPPPHHYDPYHHDHHQQPMFGVSLHASAAGGKKAYNSFRKNSSSLPPEMEDEHDLLVKEKHTLVYPTSKQFNAVREMLAHAEKWLRQVQQQQQPPPLPISIKLIKRINTVAKGLLSTTDLDLDLLVLTSDWPTHSFVQTIYQHLHDCIMGSEEASSFEVTLCEDSSVMLRLTQVVGEAEKKEGGGDGEKKEEGGDEGKVEETAAVAVVAGADVKDETEGGSEEKDEEKMEVKVEDEKETVVINCQIHFAYESPKGGKETEVEGEEEEEGRLKREVVQACLQQLQHTKWFQANANCLPSCVMVLRVVKAVCKAHPVLSSLPDQAMELLMTGVLSAYNSSARPGQAFRFFVEALCQGVLVGGGGGGGGGASDVEEEEEGADGGGVDGSGVGVVKEVVGADGNDNDGGEAKVEGADCDASKEEDDNDGNPKKGADGDDDACGDKGGKESGAGASVCAKKEHGSKSKYDFVVDKELMTSWWKRKKDDDTDVLASMTGESRREVTAEAKRMLEAIRKGDMHLILGLEKRVAKQVVSVDAVKQQEEEEVVVEVDASKVNGDASVAKEKEAGDDMEVGNSPVEDEDDAYIPSKKRQKFSFEKQEGANNV